MKEFNKWFTISFSYKGKDIEHTISLNKVITEPNYWLYRFDDVVKGDVYHFEVYGTLDDKGNVRTSGDCLVNGETMSAVFGINVDDGIDKDNYDEISDIDIIDCD